MEEQQTADTQGQPLAQMEAKQNHQSFWEMFRFGVIALLFVILIRTFIIQPFIVSGSSMVPTFENGQYLIIDEVSYKFHEPKRDEIIIFKYPKDTTKYFIKRVIGLPGETVEIKGSVVTIKNEAHPDGFALSEPFIKNEANNKMSLTLGEDEYFVMGDNRSASSDSRFWGPVPKNLIVGKVLLRLWPFNKIAVRPGSYAYEEKTK